MKATQVLLPLLSALILIGCNNSTEEGTTGASGNSGTSGPISSAGGHMESMRRTYHTKDLDRGTLKVNGADINAWVMDDDAKRQEGMMWLVEDDVKDNDGMIFVFPDSDKRAFWMHDTILALDIIYIKSDKTVDSIQLGKPYDETSLPSDGPAQYVLELKEGCAKKFGIKKGTKFEIPDSVKAKQ